MAATTDNAIWLKSELALVRWVNQLATGVNEANVHAGHDNDDFPFPRICCECHSWDPEIPGKPVGNWICHCTITITTKLADETGLDNSGRFASITDGLMDRGVADLLSNSEEFFTCFLCLAEPGNKRIVGDRLVVEQNLSLTCCGSVII